MSAQRIFILTGAGVSSESGLSTFRDKGGLWAHYDVQEVASIQGYERNPAYVLEFYNMRRGIHAGIEPNASHIALAQLESGWEERGGRVTICTQNIDPLHERAGSKRVIHMHGEIKPRFFNNEYVRAQKRPARVWPWSLGGWMEKLRFNLAYTVSTRFSDKASRTCRLTGTLLRNEVRISGSSIPAAVRFNTSAAMRKAAPARSSAQV
jgi:hypothetical protein